MLPEHFKLDINPVASHDATITTDKVRFTVLTERLIRLEYDPGGVFENRASQMMWYRQQPVPKFTVQRDDTCIIIETSALLLSYTEGLTFTPESLSIRVKGTDTVWYPGDVDTRNLKGTTRTLDFVNGYTPLTDGLMSRSGWALVDDSASLVFNDDWWLEPRSGNSIDWYFFAYGHDYKAGLQDYCAVSGSMPLVPRWILGNWWSRFWAYTQEDMQALINDFESHEIPLSVCIVDMDWHVTETNNDSTGWTGYTWNRELFPDPQGLIDFFHDKGLRTAMNLHPAEGIHSHEEQYPEMARRMGIDPATKKPVEFDIADPEFVKAYFEVLHYPFEKMGIDFWWVDWQQGLDCKIPGLDPLWLINHLHFQDTGKYTRKRPFIFSRWGNEGHQRYPIGFSGDSYMTWEMLRFEPYMTATASNVAYGWWSHDIGGHTSGKNDSELFTRWVQFGVFSPIMRIHTTKGYYYDQRPWTFDGEVNKVLRETMQLRHALIPYTYTMAWRAHKESLPLMLPMYYDYPEEEAAYHCPQQYLFGSQLIAAPYVDPADPDTGLARQVVWLPEGDWYHFFTGEHFAGDQWHAIYGALDDIPIFAKAGAILPLGEMTGWGGIDNPEVLNIHAFAGADNTFTLYEDDGSSREFMGGNYCLTTISQQWSDQQLSLTINASEGNTALIPAERTFNLHIHGVKADVEISVKVDQDTITTYSSYDETTETLTIHGIRLKPTSALTLTVQTTTDSLLSQRDRKRDTLLNMVGAFHLHNGVRNKIADLIDTILEKPEEIAPYLLPMSPSQVRALCEILYEAGVYHVPDTHHPTLLVLWNNREDDAITYRYGDAYLFFGFVNSANHHNGVMPRFQTIIPKIQTWAHGTVGEHVRRTQWEVHVDYHNIASVTETYREATP